MEIGQPLRRLEVEPSELDVARPLDEPEPAREEDAQPEREEELVEVPA